MLHQKYEPPWLSTLRFSEWMRLVNHIWLFLLIANFILLSSQVWHIVLKTGSDLPVRPVEPWTGGVSSSIYLLDRLCSRTGENRRDSLELGDSAGLVNRTESLHNVISKDKKTRKWEKVRKIITQQGDLAVEGEKMSKSKNNDERGEDYHVAGSIWIYFWFRENRRWE